MFFACTCEDEDATLQIELHDDPKLRVDARVVLVEHCGDCHMQDSPHADKKALAAIDFTELRWAAGLDALKSRRIIDNLAAGTASGSHVRPGGHYGTLFSVPPGQYMVVRDYLASIDRHKQHVSTPP